MNTNRSSSYIMTYVPGDIRGENMKDWIRGQVRDHNKRNPDNKFRICRRGRFGKNNPNRAKYGKYWQHGWCRLEDAARIDVYVYKDGLRYKNYNR